MQAVLGQWSPLVELTAVKMVDIAGGKEHGNEREHILLCTLRLKNRLSTVEGPSGASMGAGCKAQE